MTELILIRGLPGSGKSTLAKRLSGFGYTHLETDMFWGNDYNFDMSKLGEAHQWCQDKTRSALKSIEDARQNFLGLLSTFPLRGVIVSNTFTTKKELEPYFDIAKEFKIKPQVIICKGKFSNVHNVPEDVLLRMSMRFKDDVDELWEKL